MKIAEEPRSAQWPGNGLRTGDDDPQSVGGAVLVDNIVLVRGSGASVAREVHGRTDNVGPRTLLVLGCDRLTARVRDPGLAHGTAAATTSQIFGRSTTPLAERRIS